MCATVCPFLLYVLQACVYFRGAVWFLFLLVKKLWGIRVSSSGWMPFSLQSFEISMHRFEVVGYLNKGDPALGDAG